MTVTTTSIFSPRASTAVQDGDALPWTLIGSALAAMAALYVSGDRFIGLPVLAVLLILSRFKSWRLPGYFLITYGSRALLLAVLLTLINQTDVQDATPWYLKQQDTNLAGYALAADIVIRAWERRDLAGAREGLGVVVLMTALLFAAATNTYERLHIQLITPVYAILLVLSLRSFAVMKQSSESRRSFRGGLILLRVIVIFFTLGFAFTAVYALNRYEYQVTNWAMQFVRQRHGEQHEIGFSPTPHLSKVFNPEPSTSRAFLIDGQITEPHLRIAAFDTYQKSDWLPAISDRTYTPLTQGDLSTALKLNDLKFTRLVDTADLLAAPLTSAAIHSHDALEQDQSGTVHDMRSSSFEPYEVRAPSSPSFQGMLCSSPDPKMRERLLAIPAELDPRVVELAKRVAGGGDIPRRLFRIQEYLRSRHAYSTAFDPHGEPLSDFILNDRAAHCQYFASAMAIMARAIDVPSRYVGGFYAHESYGNDETVVRQRDAHAWTECWIDGIGWITMDATRSGDRPDGVFTDPPAWKRWWEKLTDLPGEIRDWISANARLLKKLAIAAAIVVLCNWLVRIVLTRRRRVPTAASLYPGPDARLIDLANRYEHWLGKHSIPCPPQVTWRAHLAASQAEQIQLRERFVRTYERARFGSDEGDATGEATQLLDQIERVR